MCEYARQFAVYYANCDEAVCNETLWDSMQGIETLSQWTTCGKLYFFVSNLWAHKFMYKMRWTSFMWSNVLAKQMYM